MSRELLLADIGEMEKSFHLFLEDYGGWEDLRVGAAVQMLAVLGQRVCWMDTKYLENKLDFIVFVYSEAISEEITLK